MKMCVKCFELTCLQLKYSTMLNFNPYKYNAIFSISAIQQAFLFQKHLALFYFNTEAHYKQLLKGAVSFTYIHTYIIVTNLTLE